MAPARPSVAVIGAGLTGLTAAWTLAAAGFDVQVFEKSAQAGGRTLTIRKEGFVFDVGAITMLPTYTQTCALAQELGIAQHLHRVTPIIGIPRNGTIHRLDLAHPVASLLSTKLISAHAKLRLMKLLPPLMRAWKLANFQTLAPLAAWDTESISSYVRRVCGEEVLDYIAGPIIRGNTLNSPDCAPFGELLWMLRQYGAPYLFGFDRGINFLAETLASRLPVTYETPIADVETSSTGVTLHGSGAGRFRKTFDTCVIALPPKDLLAIAPFLNPRQRDFLAAITPLPSVSLHVGLGRRPAATETFILPPTSEQPDMTTIVLDHLKAPGRAPPGKGVVSFFLSDRWSKMHFDRADAEIQPAILAMAKPFLGDIAADVDSSVVRRWPYAIIKSEVGLYHGIAAYEAALDPTDICQAGGDFLSMGMEAAVSSGARMARNLIAHHGTRRPHAHAPPPLVLSDA